MTASRFLAALTLAVPVLLVGCGVADEPDTTPEEALASARTQLDETTGVRLGLEATDLPAEVNGLVSAAGVATHEPAFDGTLKVSGAGATADVEVVSTAGRVYAKLPFSTEFTEIEPADYAAPDPADLMSTEDGLSSLLTAAREVEAGDEVRDGEDVLSTYTGVLTGEDVAAVIPSAEAGGSFDATFTLDDDDRLDRVVLTGPFYPDTDDVTYTIDLDEYGVEPDITAP